ncbi:hypothetical protein [Paracoccus seriniphilus]|uniref:hypothetical protein n=1 Tax=Paracoccus seriniphilus TaxID=184748 RepID=UPI0035626B11
MSDINASERRLSAALDRIDQLLEAGGPRRAGGDDAEIAELRDSIATLDAENTRLANELAALRTQRAGPLEAALAEARARLEAVGNEAARLSAANDDLAAANRALIEAASGNGDQADATIQTLEAEITALRAARAAEIAQMGDIMQELERLMAQQPTANGASLSAALPEVAGDGAGVPDVESDQDGER